MHRARKAFCHLVLEVNITGGRLGLICFLLLDASRFKKPPLFSAKLGNIREKACRVKSVCIG